jgi:HrpA-like RNA helicase
MAALHAAGAIRGGARGRWLDGGSDGGGGWELTVLGRHLSRMPLDVRLGRMLLFAAVLGCVGPALTVAATLSARRCRPEV